MLSRDEVAKHIIENKTPNWYAEEVMKSYLDPVKNENHIGVVSAHLSIYQLTDELEEYIDRLLAKNSLSQADGHNLIDSTIYCNLQKTLVRLLQRFPWDIDSFDKGFPLFGLAARETDNGKVEPKPIFNLLIENGQLEFASKYGDKSLSDEHHTRVCNAIKQTYKDLISSSCFDIVMEAMSQALKHGKTMQHLADEGLFDSDNQSAYKRWLLKPENEPGKPYSRSPKRI